MEFEGVCVNVFERDLLLLLDGFPEGADEFVVCDFDGKNVAGIIVI